MRIILLTLLTLPCCFSAPKSVLLENIPHIEQQPDFCGEACVAMFLQHLGKPHTQEDVFNASGLDPVEGRGCYTRELQAALIAMGFDPGKAAYTISATKAQSKMHQHFSAVHADLLQGIPAILCMHYNDQPKTTEHFRLIVGYDAKTDEVIYHEPAEADGGYKRMKRSLLYTLWPLKYDRTNWTLIRMALKPKQLKAPIAHASFSDAAYAQHILALKKRLPSDDFHIVLQRPFVVIGNEKPEQVRLRAEQTVHWATTHLKEQYFTRDPEEILDVWLFKDAKTYNKYNQEMFGGSPTTPFGYYSRQYKALVMNINTGGGTLVHEIVHPFMESNFPGYAAWFNEGLASLYEQCGERKGQMVGFTNWRLAGLKKAITSGEVPTFQRLCSTTTDEFYHQDRGTNYSQARYLCYYLQEKGLLKTYYETYRANADSDPSGYESLKQVLKQPDMKAFQKSWEAFVTRLRFP
ncbi:MAG: hypothetical protein ACI97B_001409 [Verrucomicrobiales bacterium]|jgi:hypothetical protein